MTRSVTLEQVSLHALPDSPARDGGAFLPRSQAPACRRRLQSGGGGVVALSGLEPGRLLKCHSSSPAQRTCTSQACLENTNLTAYFLNSWMSSWLLLWLKLVSWSCGLAPVTGADGTCVSQKA